MCDLSLSSYVQVRRAAQKGLDSMSEHSHCRLVRLEIDCSRAAHYFDGARSILFDRLFEALKPSTDHDAMKGALYVLGSKMLGNLAILDWRFGPRYLLALLECSHQERPSVQQLVKTITHDFVIRLAEPSTLKASVHSPALKNAADELEKLISIPVDADLLARVAAKSQARVAHKNAAYAELVSPSLLSSPERCSNSRCRFRNCSRSPSRRTRIGGTVSLLLASFEHSSDEIRSALLSASSARFC